MKELISVRSKIPLIFFLSSLGLLAIVLGFIFSEIMKDIIVTVINPVFRFVAVPYSAAGVTVKNGVAEFQGVQPRVISQWQYLSVVCSLIISFVVIPLSVVMFKKSIKAYAERHRTPPRFIMLGYRASYATLFIMAIMFVSYIFVSVSFLSKMKNENSINQYREDVFTEMGSIALKAEEFFILPESEGGGGKSFQKEGAPVTLSDLGFKGNTSLGRYLLFRQKSDTILYLHFIGTKPGRLTSGGHNPDITHVVEYEGLIYPSSFKVLTLN